MSTASLEKIHQPRNEKIQFMAHSGMKDLLETYRRQMGLRSISDTARQLVERGMEVTSV